MMGGPIDTLPEHDLNLLKKIFDEAKIPQRVILFVKAPFEYFVSLNQQHIKSGHSKGLYCSNRKFRVSQQIEQIRSVFPNAEFTPLTLAQAHPGGPVAYFLKTIGVPPDQLRIIRENESLCRQAVELLAYINSHEPLRLANRNNPNRRRSDFAAFGIFTGEKYGVTRQELEPFEAYLTEQNKWLSENLGEAFADQSRKHVTGNPTWSEQNIPELRKVLRKVTPLMRGLIADYFKQKMEPPRSLILQLHEIAQRSMARS